MPRLASTVMALLGALAPASVLAFDGEGAPPVGEPVEASFFGWRSLVLEYRIDAPPEELWRLYTTTPLGRLLPSGWTRPTLRTYRAVCPDRRRSYPTDLVWPELVGGLEIHGFLDWGPTHQPEDMIVSELEPNRRLAFRYAERSPAEGEQTIDFVAETTAAGAPAVRVIHGTLYRARNPVNGAFYPYVHRALLDSWHLGAKYYLETRGWAGRWCETGAPPDRTFEALLKRAQAGAEGPLRADTFRRALCLFSLRAFGAASEIPRTENSLARWLGDLAWGLSTNEYAALKAYRRSAEADAAALAAGADACK